MIRDFTDETKTRLLKQINEVDNEKWNVLTDKIGDVFLHIGKWTQILSLDDDMSNVKSYQKKVLDMTNMTRKELKDIFKEVYSIDSKYKSNFKYLTERQKKYNQKITILTSLIKPNFDIASASSIKSAVMNINEELKSADSIIDKKYKAELDYAAKMATAEGAKHMVGGLVGVVTDVLLMPINMTKNLATHQYIGIGCDVWNLLNDFFKMGSGIAGIFSAATLLGNDADTKESLLSDPENYSKVKNQSDLFKYVFGWEAGSKLIDKVDRFADGYSLVTDVKDFIKNPNKLVDFKFGFTTGYSPLKKSEMAKSVQSSGEWRKYQRIYREMYRYNKIKIVKNLKNTYDYVSGVLENTSDGIYSIIDETGKNISEKVLKPIKDLEKITKIRKEVASWF